VKHRLWMDPQPPAVDQSPRTPAKTLTLRQNVRVGDAIQIGEVASRTGLSLRTVRYYESVGLVTPSGRSEGGFRLYTEPDIERLLLIRSLKPCDFSLDEVQELMALRDALSAAGLAGEAHRIAELRYRTIVDEAEHRIRTQRERLIAAELAVKLLRNANGSATSSPEPAVR